MNTLTLEAVLGLGAIVLPVVLAAVMATSWYKDRKAAGAWWTRIVDIVADVAVAKTEAELVPKLKAQTGAAHLTDSGKLAAKTSAKDVFLDIAGKLDPRIAELPLDDIFAAIEAAVARAKAEVPAKTLSKFDKLRSWVLLAAALAVGATGCASIPLDWEYADSDVQTQVADVLMVKVYAAKPDAPELVCLDLTGKLGATVFRSAPDKMTTNQALKAAVIAMGEYSRNRWPELFRAGDLATLVRQVSGLDCGDTDALLGLLEAALRLE